MFYWLSSGLLGLFGRPYLLYEDGSKMSEIEELFWNEEKVEMYTKATETLLLEIYQLDEEYYRKRQQHFIRFLEHRLKTEDSILEKLERKNKRNLNKPVDELLNDIAGVRIICFDTKQIYKIVKRIKQMKQFVVLKEKNYISNPKDNGYQSYHMILLVNHVKVELQIRTILMDAWSSLESILIYKKRNPIPDELKRDIENFSKLSKKMDKMLERILEETNYREKGKGLQDE